MTSRCGKHKKEIIGGCMWCGGNLCKLCVSAVQGSKKFYCEKCVHLLGVEKNGS